MTDTAPLPSHRQRLRARLWAPTDVAGLVAFRVVFGLLMFASTVRFIANGWIDEFFLRPRFAFKYWGAEWVTAWPGWGLYLHFAVLAVLALFVAAGLFYRISALLFFLGFTYVELIDVTYYLNHYYLVSLLALLIACLPLHRAYSLDARRRPALRAQSFPAWYTYLLRTQVGVVYFYAGLAKAGSDWLLHAQPLSIWLSARTDLPVIGPILGQRWAWYAFSWAGFLFDTTIVAFLLWRRSRVFAYGVVIIFHALTKVLFPIGMFPFIMVTGALIFFSPSWPRVLLARLRPRPSPVTKAPPLLASPDSIWARRLLPLAAVYCLFQVLVPLRHRLYGGDVLWHEQGMRFSWKVMLREKNGSITFVVTSPAAGRTWYVSPRKYLTDVQEREMAGQPDLIVQLARRVAADYRAQGYADVEVRADALVSLNGRPGAPLVDPRVDLAQIKDGLAPASFILPPPTVPPIRLNPA